MKLYIDNKLEGVRGGIHGVANNASVYVGIFNHDGYIPDITDRFDPPSSSTIIQSIV